MSKIQYFIVVHSPKLIELFEANNKYAILDRYKYVLVGNHADDYSNSKIIQCDKLEHNIENFNNYLAYTGWWAIGKNNLIDDDIDDDIDHVFFLEYDTIISNNQLELMELNISNSKNEIMGIASLKIENCFFTPIHGVSLKQFISQEYKGTKLGEKCINMDDNWIVTNNVVSKDKFLINL
jgi:hypothetical protein